MDSTYWLGTWNRVASRVPALAGIVWLTANVHADVLLGFYPKFGGAGIVRLGPDGHEVKHWSGLYESIDGLTVMDNGVVLSTENRLGALTVRGWDANSGGQVATLTDHANWEAGHFNGAGIAAGLNGAVYVSGSYFDWRGPTPPDKLGLGIARLQLGSYVDQTVLEPWIPYGVGGKNSAFDLATDKAGNLFVGSDLGLLEFDGISGALKRKVADFSALGVGAPGAMVFGLNSSLYMLDGGNSIKLIDSSTGTLVRTVISSNSGLLSGAWDMDIAADGTLFVLANSGHNVLNISPESGALLGNIDLSPYASGSNFPPSSLAVYNVPEPSRWALLGLGAGVLWVALNGRDSRFRPVR